MSSFIPNSPNNHALISSSQEYMFDTKILTIDSTDINTCKYPSTSDFEIELPQDYINVQSIVLNTFDFPSNINNFSFINNNTIMSFIINNPYLYVAPADPAYVDGVYNALYQKLLSNNPHFIINIDDGQYTETFMTNELTNKFNLVVTEYIIEYFNSIGDTTNLTSFNAAGGYTSFTIANNELTKTIYFGNNSSGFILTNSYFENTACNQISKSKLPANLGLLETDMDSVATTNINDVGFFYLQNPSINWLKPAYSSTQIYYVKGVYNWSPYSIIFYMYMEISSFNTIDEIMPFTNIKHTENGIVNAAFAKIPVYTNNNVPVNNIYYTTDADKPTKIFNPPLNRIKKLKIKLRTHANELINFNGLPYSFSLKIQTFLPQKSSKYTMYKPESI